MMTLATVVLADISLESLLWWIVIGLIAGFLASHVVRGAGYGMLGDIIAGIVGAFIGGWLFGVLGISAGGGLLGSIITAFIGAVIFIIILRAIAGMPRRRI
ncbi:MAG TPA: GlsB/YeaQ/YmgE family stress response membrane protein [Ktedonobacteraceae bacterium]|nr:GlsB/YeaQ/YmgE family stress response membrane protein [Ktedonobacteraceae bacterium]